MRPPHATTRRADPGAISARSKPVGALAFGGRPGYVVGVSTGDQPGRDEERRQLRPYRRFLAILLAISITGLCALILRGIVRTLDRLPSTETMQRLEVVDSRAIAACAEDLERLEARVRKAGGEALALAEPAPAPEDFETVANTLETERLTVVARCRLDEPRGDVALEELARAAVGVEELLRAYTLLVQRHSVEVRTESREIGEALERARTSLRAR